MNGCPRAAVFVRAAFLQPSIPPMAIAHAEVTCQNQSVYSGRAVSPPNIGLYTPSKAKAGITQRLIIAACRCHY
jgi:hypothetical protein